MSATIDELLHYLDTTARVSCPEITCERAAELAEVMRVACQKTMSLEASAVAAWNERDRAIRDRDEARRVVNEVVKERIKRYQELAEQRERFAKLAEEYGDKHGMHTGTEREIAALIRGAK